MAETVMQNHSQQWFRLEEFCGSTLRALSNNPHVYFRGDRLYQKQTYLPLHIPHLDISDSQDISLRQPDYRGIADGVAMRLLFCNETLHQQYRPTSDMNRLIFEVLEQLRVEALVPAKWSGVRQNLRNRFTSWSETCYQQGLTESSSGIMFYTLIQMCWSRLNGYPVIAVTEDLTEPTRAGIAPLFGSLIASLKKAVNDQQSYAAISLEIAQAFAHAVMKTNDDLEQEDDLEDLDITKEQQNLAEKLKLWINFDNADTHIAVANNALSKDKKADFKQQPYQVFSRDYDQELNAAQLLRPELLIRLREHLDHKIRAQHINIYRISQQWQTLLTAPENEGWLFHQEQGYIDSRLLSRIVTSPAERKIFRQQDQHPTVNTSVSFLLDCSGSMKLHSESIAVFLDTMATILNRIGIATEILGFTTTDWNGGKVLTDWIAKGRPKNPGRLNGIQHIVYKSVNTPWRRAKRDLAALLKSDRYREGVDGEALQWAADRLSQRHEPRKILIVISDGCPMDTATHLANQKNYLDHHLQNTVASIEKNKQIELYGIGVGLDLSCFYRHSIAVNSETIASNSTFSLLFELIHKARKNRNLRSTVLFNSSKQDETTTF